jgi:hypothetical protein
MGGTFDYSVLVVVRAEYALWGWKRVGDGECWCARCWVLRDRACCCSRLLSGSWGGGGSELLGLRCAALCRAGLVPIVC